MIALITGALQAIAALPKIGDQIEKLINKIGDIIDYFEMKQKTAEMRDAIVKASTTKDTSDIERILRGLPKL